MDVMQIIAATPEPAFCNSDVLLGRSPKPKASTGSPPSPRSSIKEKNADQIRAEKNAAKLRDNAVTMQLTKTKMCAFFERGKCASINCRYAHSTSELRSPPNLQKTKLCRAFLAGGCTDENCFFAHGETDLRVTEGIYKTQMCNFFERGYCKKGDRCNHAHGSFDLRPCAQTPSLPYTPLAGEKGEPTRSRRSPLPLSELLVIDNEANLNLSPNYGIPPTPTKSITPSVADLAQLGFSPVHSSPLWAQYGMHPLSPMSGALGPMGDGMSMWPPRDAVDMLVQDPHIMSPTANLMYGMDMVEPSMEMLEHQFLNHTPTKTLQLLCLDSSPTHRPAPGLLEPRTVSTGCSSTDATRSTPPGLVQHPSPETRRDPLMVNLSERLASLDAVCLGLGSDIAAIKSDKRLHRI